MGIGIDRLMGPSHVLKIQELMQLTDQAIRLLPDLLEAVYRQELETCHALAKTISQLEAEVDEKKHELRHSVSRSLFFPLPKRDFIHFILQLDGISDSCELLAKTFTYRTLSCPEQFKGQFGQLIQHVLALHERFFKIMMEELPALFEASFGGFEAQAVSEMLDAFAKQIQQVLEQVHLTLVELFQLELSVPEFLIWQKAIMALEKTGLSMEKSASALRALLEK